MRQGQLNDAIFQVAALITAIIFVHAIYVALIRPSAELVQEQQNFLQENDENFVPERSIFIILKDY